MLGKKAVQVAPEPVGSSCRLPQEESGPLSLLAGKQLVARPSGGSVWRSGGRRHQLPEQALRHLLGQNGGGPGCSCAGGTPGQGGSQARQLWGFLSRKQRSQEPSARSQQEPSPCLATEEPPDCPG
ncbi:hypothetical protein G0U57_005055 [Chelydra serpentina]|uniref:Uncharacterized protein n=1 Tax=Chelydra serpentina TaxID=8475 RepID=A0A8T1RYM3_CHESE|nr:hypothetical protein G0U57_005055 [Chelydra serpentina]